MALESQRNLRAEAYGATQGDADGGDSGEGLVYLLTSGLAEIYELGIVETILGNCVESTINLFILPLLAQAVSLFPTPSIVLGKILSSFKFNDSWSLLGPVAHRCIKYQVLSLAFLQLQSRLDKKHVTAIVSRNSTTTVGVHLMTLLAFAKFDGVDKHRLSIVLFHLMLSDSVQRYFTA